MAIHRMSDAHNLDTIRTPQHLLQLIEETVQLLLLLLQQLPQTKHVDDNGAVLDAPS